MFCFVRAVDSFRVVLEVLAEKVLEPELTRGLNYDLCLWNLSDTVFLGEQAGITPGLSVEIAPLLVSFSYGLFECCALGMGSMFR